MVSSFSNPGFPPVDAHPTRLPAMDARLSAAIDSFEASMRAALRDAIREAFDSAFANLTTNFSRDWALLRRDSALRAAGVSDPVPTISDHTQSIDLGHPELQGDDNPPRLPSPIEVHSVPPLFSSSPLLREIAVPSVKPQLNSNASMAAHTNNSTPFSRNQEAPTTVQGFGIHDGDGSPQRIQCPQRIEFPQLNDDPFSWSFNPHTICLYMLPLTHTNTTKRRHKVLTSLLSNSTNRKDKWYWVLQVILAYYTGVIVIMYDDFLTDKCGWGNWYLVGQFVKKNFYALQLFDRLSKRGSANVHVLYVASLDMHDLEASPKLDGSSSKPRVKEVSSEEKDNVSHIEIKITEYHSSDEKCVLRYLNLSDNAMGNYGVNAKSLGFTKLGSPKEAKKVVGNMNDVTASAKQLKEMEQGLISLIVLGNGRLSDLIAQLQDILEGVNEADILPEKFDNAVIKAQIPQLAREIRELTSSRPVTIYNENSSSSGNYASYLVPLAALAAMGYCYMWWRDWLFSDVMYVTRHNMANVVEALIREVASKSNDFAGNGTTNTLKMSECAMGTYLDLVCSLSHLESNFGGALVIDLHVEFSLFFTCNPDYRLLWDPGDAMAKTVKMILYFKNVKAEWLNRVTKITKFGSFMVQLDRSVETLNKGKKQKTGDGGYGDEMKRLHDLSVNKAVDMATRFESALVGHVNNIICSTTVRLERLHSDDWWCSAISQLLMIGKSILSSSNKTQEANVDAVLGTGDPSLLVENTSVEQLGFVRKVTIFKDSTSIIGDAASKDGLQVHGVSPFDIMGRNLFWEKQLQRLQMGAVTRKFMVVNFSSGFDESSYLSRVENFEEMSQENYGEATGNKNSLTQFKRAAIPGRIIMISKSSSTIPFLSLEDKANFQGGSIVMTQIINEVLCFITVRNC